MHTALNRRSFLAGAGAFGLAALTGCGGDDTAADEPEEPAPTGERILGAAFATGLSTAPFIAAGIAQRAPLIIFEDGRPLRDNAPKTIDVEVSFGGAVVTKQTIAVHEAEIPTPYYPLVITPAAAGEYTVTTPFSKLPVQFRAGERSAIKLAQVGDPIRSIATPTTANNRGVNPICTRTPNACPLHGTSFDEIVAAKQPVALLISTPGFCQTGICGPVLELLVDESKKFPNMKFVHAEVYIDPQEFANNKPNPRTTDAVKTYALSYEPSLIVANAAGLVAARLDFTWDRADLQAALRTAS